MDDPIREDNDEKVASGRRWKGMYLDCPTRTPYRYRAVRIWNIYRSSSAVLSMWHEVFRTKQCETSSHRGRRYERVCPSSQSVRGWRVLCDPGEEVSRPLSIRSFLQGLTLQPPGGQQISVSFWRTHVGSESASQVPHVAPPETVSWLDPASYS